MLTDYSAIKPVAIEGNKLQAEMSQGIPLEFLQIFILRFVYGLFEDPPRVTPEVSHGIH